MNSSLGNRAAMGAIVNGTSQMIRILLGLLLTVIVARVLSPEDFGLVAMVAPIAALAALIPSFGLGQALIQAEDLSREQIQSAFWVSVALGIFCVACLLLAAPLIGIFFEDPRASHLTIAAAATLFVTNLSTVHSAVITREMRFGTLSIGDLISSATLFSTTLLLALVLENYWALWAGSFMSALFASIYFWTVSVWRPAIPPDFTASSSLWKFSSAVTGFNILNYLARNVDNLLIGKVAGAHSLGLYDRSYRLMTFPLSNLTEPLGKIMLPVLSQLRRNPRKFRLAFLRVAWIVMLFTAPAAIVVASASEAVIVGLLGDRWAEARGIFFWLSIGAIYQPLSSITGWLFISLGRGREMMHWALISSLTTIASFAVGIFWGAEGVAQAYVLTSFARLPLLYFWTTNATPVSQADLYMILLPPIAAGTIIAFLAYIGEPRPSLFVILVRAGLAYAISIMVAVTIPMGRAALIELTKQLTSMWGCFRRRSGTKY